MVSFNSSSRFPLSSGFKLVDPVMFPPGRGQAGDKPAPDRIGSVRHDYGNCLGCILMPKSLVMDLR